MWPINVRVAPEGSTEDERQHRYWYSFVSLTTKSPPPQPVHKKRSGVSLWVFSPPRWDSRPGSASLSAAFFNFQQLFFSPALSFVGSTWRSGGWRRWTPAGQRADPHLKTATFISPRQSQTAAGLWSYRATPRRCTTTRLWLILAGRCPET